MLYCKRCGNKNPDNAKYCTSCGSSLQVISVYVSNESNKPIKKNYGQILSIIFIIIGALALYFFVLKTKKENKIAGINEKKGPQEPVVIIPDNNSNQIQSESEQYTLADKLDLTRVQEEISNFYECENNDDVECLLAHYKYPIDQYYAITGLSIDSLRSMITRSFANLKSHELNVDWGDTEINRSDNGYIVHLNTNYNAEKNSPHAIIDRKIPITILLNGDLKITSIFERK